MQYRLVPRYQRGFSDDVTVGTCWDADRLDLGRVSIDPDPRFLNTKFARQLARELDLEKKLRELDATAG